MIKLCKKTKTVSLIKTRTLSNKDLALIKKLDADGLKAYLMSKLGKEPAKSANKTQIRDVKSAFQVETSGPVLVRHQENHFLNIFERKFAVGEKVPQSLSSRYFGIEIECMIPFESMGLDNRTYQSKGEYEDECYDCGGSGTMEFTNRNTGHSIESDCPTCEGSGMVTRESDEDDGQDPIDDVRRFFNKKVKALRIKGLDIHHDGSIDADDDELCPVELTVLVKQDDLSDLEKVCALLNELGAIVNKSCGLHVHLDARGLTKGTVKAIGQNFGDCMEYLGLMVPKSRLNNHYCKTGVSEMSGCRYFAVNLTAFEKHKTIEIRLHSSTTSFEKIKNWLKVVSAIFSNSVKTESKVGSLQEFFAYIGADSGLKKYIIERAEKFHSEKFYGKPEGKKQLDLEESDLSDEPNCAA